MTVLYPFCTKSTYWNFSIYILIQNYTEKCFTWGSNEETWSILLIQICKVTDKTFRTNFFFSSFHLFLLSFYHSILHSFVFLVTFRFFYILYFFLVCFLTVTSNTSNICKKNKKNQNNYLSKHTLNMDFNCLRGVINFGRGVSLTGQP